jgi:hypothetical protein
MLFIPSACGGVRCYHPHTRENKKSRMERVQAHAQTDYLFFQAAFAVNLS